MRRRTHALAPLAAAALAASPAAAVDAVRVAYFLEWPTPNLAAKADGAYDAALGTGVTWIAFDTGTQMTEAMRAGEVDIAYSQGLAPFVAAVDEGVPLTLVGVAVEYPPNDCVIREGSGLDPSEPGSFAGRTAALPVATMADYSFRAMTRALGIDAGSMTVLDRIPSEAATALLSAEADLACGFGALAMERMRSAGPLLMDGAAKRDAGIAAFDVVSARTDFARREPEAVEAFLDVTAAANATWTGSPEQLEKVGLESGLNRSLLLGRLADFEFPTPDAQRALMLGPRAPVPTAMGVIGEAFAGDGAPAREDYSDVLDPGYLP